MTSTKRTLPHVLTVVVVVISLFSRGIKNPTDSLLWIYPTRFCKSAMLFSCRDWLDSTMLPFFFVKLYFMTFATKMNNLYSKRNWDKRLIIGLKIKLLYRYQITWEGMLLVHLIVFCFCCKRLHTREYSLVKLHTLLIYILWQIIHV